ncbi:hypothetical protein D9619_000978 [Psilocybe cf. subviscida]|uniref:Translational machinery component n=1 Tax=Psilocybe cf. subviscida TaxID=2480587 RepID=A0A8H5BEG5_9AGAR|nr:hypothetical protein D9619_000978 [Psilocybe cf. subviscida]
MFALRSSASSVLRVAARRPVLSAQVSRFPPKPPAPQHTQSEFDNVASFLEQGDATAPTKFEVEDAPPRAKRGFARSRTESDSNLPTYRLHCHSTRNNTITTFTKDDGSTIAWASGGQQKFKGANRSSYEAGYKCAVAMFDAIAETRSKQGFKLSLFFKGFGEGREAMKTALLGAEGTAIRPLIKRVTDRTPLKIGGTRSKKARRV